MKGCIAGLMLAALSSIWVAACGAGDDVVDGTRANCAYGGVLTDCPDAERTAEAACWRLVDCGAIAIHHETNEGAFDWDTCVNDLETLTDDRQRLIVACIAAATCDELRVPGSPDDPREDLIHCLRFGGER